MNKNPDLVQLSQTLNDIARQLHDKKAATNDPSLYIALNNELIEVNHRITGFGGQIFAQRTDEITLAVSRVEESKDELARAIEEIDRFNDFIEAVTGFLGLVDTVIDLAKRF